MAALKPPSHCHCNAVAVFLNALNFGLVSWKLFFMCRLCVSPVSHGFLFVIVCCILLLRRPRRPRRQCCLSVIHSVGVDYWRSNQPILLKLVVMIGPTNQKNWLTFGGAVVPDTDSASLSLPSPLWIGMLGDLLAFCIIQSLASFHDTHQNDWSRQDSESATCWERSTRHPD